jgi:hypothetical protein
MVSHLVFVLANPRLPTAYFAKRPKALDLRLPQSRSPRPCGLPIPNASTCELSRVQTASYPDPNHIVAKSDELTLMESHSCTKPRGEGVPERASDEGSSSRLPSLPEPRGGAQAPGATIASRWTCCRFSPTRHSFRPLRLLHFCTLEPCNLFRINTSKTAQICIKTKDFNLLRINTYKLSHLALKTKDFKSL